MTTIRVWHLVFGNINGRKTKLSHVHAVVSSVLDSEHWVRVKPWSIGMLKSETHEVASLRITTIGDEAAGLLVDSFVPGAKVRFGDQVGFLLGPPVLDFEVDDDFLAGLPPKSGIKVKFHTPTTFRIEDSTTPLIDLGRVLHSVGDRWSVLFGNPQPGYRYFSQIEDTMRSFQATVLKDSIVTSVDGHTRILRFSGKCIAGFVGTMTFSFRSEFAALTFTPLFGLAGLTGLGSYTTRGLGDIELLDSANEDIPR